MELLEGYHRERDLRRLLEEARRENHELRYEEERKREVESKRVKTEVNIDEIRRRTIDHEVLCELRSLKMQVGSSQKGDEERGRSRRKDPRGDGGGRHKLKNKGQIGEESTAWTELKLPELNTTLEKVWEEVILTEEISAPPNLGREPVPGSKSHEFCRYHRFHGHHTNSCRSVRKIIHRLIKQGKLAHYIDRKETPMITCHHKQAKESRERRRLGCNFIAHSRGSFHDFEDNVLSRVYKVDRKGNEIMNSPKE
ncbi:uncharacterized protein LOC113272193 [Papaver somniferum]|uniref:uncharacterized protein LOC113272193 n=1 Tax=Papaver somniferum TaxID=3469 RepID=UPI000E700511|nr:uncharacterized protein LOC113272193 [Papaver somniferum]